MNIEDISKKEGHQTLKQNKIIVKSLPGYSNMGLKRKEIMECGNDGCAI